MATYIISSVKQSEQFVGSRTEALSRARKLNAEYQPALGVSIKRISKRPGNNPNGRPRLADTRTAIVRIRTYPEIAAMVAERPNTWLEDVIVAADKKQGLDRLAIIKKFLHRS